MNSKPVIYKVIGGPGTGKTTRVVGNPDIEDHTSLVQENLEEHPLEQQMIVTYTNSGVDEAADRLERILNKPRYKIDERVTTIHSQCYHTLGLDREQVVNWWDKKQFCGTYDIVFQGDDDENDIMSADKAEGDSFFDIYGWLKSNRKGIEEYEDCPQPWEGENNFVWLAERWDMYKEENNLIDFSGMIERVVELAYQELDDRGLGVLFPDESTTAMEMFKAARADESRDPSELRGIGPFVDTRVLYVDEVQDLTPLQWCWYLAQKLVANKVYLGGDDDQAIYGWAGADPEFMLGEEGDFEVLEKTYRIPAEVWHTCDGVIRQVDNRQEKEIVPHGDGGEVHKYRNPSQSRVIDHIEENDGDTFILLRARYMIDEYTDVLHKHGIPYDNMSTFDTWEDDVVKVRDALAKIEQAKEQDEVNKKISGDAVQALIDLAPEGTVNDSNGFGGKQKAMANWSGAKVDDVQEIFNRGVKDRDGNISYRRYINKIDDSDKLNYYQKEAVKGNVKNENWDMQPEDVRIGTIHSSKGKEAETVILGLDSTQTIMGNMEDDVNGVEGKKISDAERRVHYVGMTRASNELLLVENLTDSDYTIKLDDLLDADEQDDANDEVTGQQKLTREDNEKKTKRSPNKKRF